MIAFGALMPTRRASLLPEVDIICCDVTRFHQHKQGQARKGFYQPELLSILEYLDRILSLLYQEFSRQRS